MIKDLQRIVKKGASDSLLNDKIVEFHRSDFDRVNLDIRNEYLKLEHLALLNTEKKILAEEGSQEELEYQANIDKLETSITELEGESLWLLDRSEEDSTIIMPVFEMTEEEINTYRVTNYSPLRVAAYDARNQFELLADDLFTAHITEVKSRFPKV